MAKLIALALLFIAGAASADEITVKSAAELRKAVTKPREDGAFFRAIFLETADYGHFSIREIDRPSLRLKPAPGAKPRFKSLSITDSRNISVERVLIESERTSDRDRLVAIRDSKHVSLERIHIRSAHDTTDWTAEDWATRASTGVHARNSDRVHVTGSLITNVRHGVRVFGDNAYITGNQISNFTADGVQFSGDDAQISGNMIHDCIDVDGNHDDGIQGWSVGEDGNGSGVLRRIVIGMNTIVQSTQDHPLRCKLQGIGLFDGIYDGVSVEFNHVIVGTLHGVSVYGATESMITHNVVHNPYGGDPASIILRDHKDGRVTEGVVVHNNQADRIRLVDSAERSGNRSGGRGK